MHTAQRKHGGRKTEVRTVLPEEERDVTEMVPCADRGGVAADGEVTEVVEADRQVAVLASKRERSI